MKLNRYPGVKPFSKDEQPLFFGRDRDIRDLADLVRVERLVVLFGKSGHGKSSLLNAGLLPRLAGTLVPIEVRLGEYIAGQSPAPLETLRRRLEERAALRTDLDFLDGLALEPSLWLAFKRRAGQPLLLVFDQFEEFFSYPPEDQQRFKAELADLLGEELPEAVREAARELPREQRRLLASAPDVRALFAIRSDRMADLDRLKDRLPAILHKRYELRALSREQAKEAIEKPALLGAPVLAAGIDDDEPTEANNRQTPDFASPPFVYREDALDRLLADLSRSNTAHQTGIESFQLQILCDAIEAKVGTGAIPIRDMESRPVVTAADLPDFATVYGEYYERRLAHLPEQQRTVARRVIEDGLVRLDLATGDGRRLSVDGDALLQQFGSEGLTAEVLRQLENTFLLRREPNTLGGFNYELSHDTLLAPITKAAKERRAAEEAERLRREREEALEREREANRKRRRALTLAWGAGVAAVLAIAASYYAFLQTREVRQKSEIIVKTEKEVLKKDSLANQNARMAADAVAEAERKKTEAEENYQQALAAQGLAAAETQRAAEAVQKAEQERLKAETFAVGIVKNLLENSDKQFVMLDYASAVTQLHDALRLVDGKPLDSPLGKVRASVAESLMEPAFFFTESGNYGRAKTEVVLAARLLGKTLVELDKVNADQENPQNLGLLRESLKQLLPTRYGELQFRYFGEGDYVKVPGGTFEMDENYRVTLSPFQLSRTETTVWQYNLFCAAQGRGVADRVQPDGSVQKESDPGWGWQGDHPVVYVSWYDAAEYANWLSSKLGLTPVYTIDRLNKDTAITSEYDDFKWRVTIVANANGFRLPTEAEWQYAASNAGRDTFEFAGGDDLDAVGWYGGNSSNRTHTVRGKHPNQLGLFDMSGNVREWCWDWYDDYSQEESTNPQGPSKGSGRVYRGGSWGSVADVAAVRSRGLWGADLRYGDLGFRLARAD